uniref:(northern house mosquito) hypothetical protein n=1 Tax=Culex pipiens TaxID=7175 RepID=A0A8D8I3K9_CULPI
MGQECVQSVRGGYDFDSAQSSGSTGSLVQGTEPLSEGPAGHFGHHLFPQRGVVGSAANSSLCARSLSRTSGQGGHPRGRLFRYAPHPEATGGLLRGVSQGEDRACAQTRGTDPGSPTWSSLRHRSGPDLLGFALRVHDWLVGTAAGPDR